MGRRGPKRKNAFMTGESAEWLHIAQSMDSGRSKRRDGWIFKRAALMEGLTTIRSNFGPNDTLNRIEAGIKARGMAVFARIDHAASAAEAGLTLRPTEVIIFGNPRGGTPLMQANQTIGIDLPLKVLVWQDASGDTWVSYNDPDWLSRRHGIGGADRVVGAMSNALSGIVGEVAEEAGHPTQRR
jgi:uncharacterized protein (DUF302 family)